LRFVEKFKMATAAPSRTLSEINLFPGRRFQRLCKIVCENVQLQVYNQVVGVKLKSQENLADAKVSARQQCVYEGP